MDEHFNLFKLLPSGTQTTEDKFIDAAYMALQGGLSLQRAIELLGDVARWKEEKWGVTH